MRGIYDIGDIIKIKSYPKAHTKWVYYLLITGFETDGKYQFLCLQANDYSPMGWKRNVNGIATITFIDRYGIQVA